MCGIIGGYSRTGEPFPWPVSMTALRRMKHRGPDDQGYWEADGMMLGNARLAIVDLAGGHQPMRSDDDQLAVVQNGAIYNFRTLAEGLDCQTSCDTEVILHLFERDGPSFVEQLNGMFAIAVADRRRQAMWLYRDRVGEKPLYWHDDGQRVLFASEIKALLALGVPSRLNEEALDAYLTFNYVPPPHTLFKGIRHLPPGHCLKVDANGTTEFAWWQLPAQSDARTSEDDWCAALRELLADSVQLRSQADVPVGAFLSGGLDSSSIVRLMSQQSTQPVSTFCMGFSDPRFNEADHAQAVARLCGTRHQVQYMDMAQVSHWPSTIYHNDQPHGDASFLPMIRLSQMARRQVKVVLTGDGSDELFAGYDVHQKFFSTRPVGESQTDFERAYTQAICLFTLQQKAELFLPKLQYQALRREPWEWTQTYFRGLHGHDRINQALGVDVKMLLPGNNLVKSDKMAMAVSLEPRAPFLDHRLVELAFQMPGSLKWRVGEGKSILKQAVADWLPKQIVHRPKQMFTVPIGEWFKGPLLEFTQAVLLNDRTLSRGLFQPEQLERLISDHSANRANYTRHLRALIALELWQRTFIDQVFDHAPTFAELDLPAPTPLRQAA